MLIMVFPCVWLLLPPPLIVILQPHQPGKGVRRGRLHAEQSDDRDGSKVSDSSGVSPSLVSEHLALSGVMLTRGAGVRTQRVAALVTAWHGLHHNLETLHTVRLVRSGVGSHHDWLLSQDQLHLLDVPGGDHVVPHGVTVANGEGGALVIAPVDTKMCFTRHHTTTELTRTGLHTIADEASCAGHDVHVPHSVVTTDNDTGVHNRMSGSDAKNRRTLATLQGKAKM